MALPDTITATARYRPGHNPPHKLGGNYYAVTAAGATGFDRGVSVLKNTAPGSSSWTSVAGDSGGSSSWDTPVISSVNDGTKIHIVYIWVNDADGGAPTLTYARFDSTDDSMEASNIAIADLSGMNAPDSSVLWCSIAYRSGATNELVVAASGLTDSSMGAPYQRVDLWHADQAVTTTGGWTGPVSIDTSATEENEQQPFLVTDSNNTDVHIFWLEDSFGSWSMADRISGRSLNSSNTLSTIRLTDSSTFSVNDEDRYIGLNPVSYDDAGTERVFSPAFGADTSAYSVNGVRTTTTSDTLNAFTYETVTTTDPFVNTSEQAIGTTVVSGTDIYLLFSGGGTAGADQDLYIITSSDGGDTWSGETEILDAVTVNYISAAVLDSGKIAYLYDDNGTTKYNEYSLSGDVDVTVGTKTFTLTTNQATVTNPTGDVNVAVNSVTFSLTPNQAAVVKDVEVTSGTASFTLTPQQADVTLDTQVDANTVNFSLTPRTATVSNDVNVGVNSASFTLTTTPATITNPNQDTNVDVGVVTFTHTENAATITYDVDVPVNTETFTLTPHQASIGYGVNVLCNSASFTFTEQQATVTYDVEVLVGTESLVLTTYPASLSEDTDVSVGTVSLSLNTFPSAISYDVNVDAQAASLSLTEQTASVIYDVDVPVGTEALSLTTHQATIQTTSDVFVNVGTVSLSLTTNQAQVAADTAIDVGTVNFTLTPLSGSVSYSVNVESTSFSFALVENQATISLDRNVQVGTVSLSLTPQTATVVAESQDTNISCGTVSLSLTEQAANISNDVNVIVSSPVSLVLQEETATLALDRNVQVDVKPFVLTPAVATVSVDKEVSVGVATLTLNTIPANILSGTGRVAAKINGVEIPQIA